MSDDAPVNVLVGDHNAPDNADTPQEKIDVADKILMFCVEPKSVLEICRYLGYKDKRSVRKHLNPLLQQGRIAMTIPDKSNSRLQ